MSSTRTQIYISNTAHPVTRSIHISGTWKNLRGRWRYQSGAWHLVAFFLAPSAADNTVVASLVGGVDSHQLNFQWESFFEQRYADGKIHVYLDGVEIETPGFTRTQFHSENYTLPDTYGTTGGTVTAKVGYLPSSGSTEGTLSPASNSITVLPWL